MEMVKARILCNFGILDFVPLNVAERSTMKRDFEIINLCFIDDHTGKWNRNTYCIRCRGGWSSDDPSVSRRKARVVKCKLGHCQ